MNDVRPRYFLLSGVIFAVGLCGLPQTTFSQDPAAATDLQNQVKSLVNEAWKSSGPVPKELQETYDSILAESKQLDKLEALWLTINIQRRQFSTASETASAISERNPNNLTALGIQAWLQSGLSNGDGVLNSLSQITAEIEKLTTQQRIDRVNEELLVRIGKVIGFWEGPMKPQIDTTRLSAIESKLADLLTASQLSVLTESTSQVLASFEDLSSELAQLKEEAAEQAKSEHKAKIASLERRRDEISKRRDRLADEEEKRKDETKAELTTIQQNAQPLQLHYQRIVARGRAVEDELAVISLENLRLEGLLRRIKDPIERQRVLFELDRLDRVFLQYERELNGIDREVAIVSQQLAQLQHESNLKKAEFIDASRKTQSEKKELSDKESNASREERYANKSQKQLRSPRIRVLSAKLAAFTTYAPFPAEEYRDRILKSIR